MSADYPLEFPKPLLDLWGEMRDALRKCASSSDLKHVLGGDTYTCFRMSLTAFRRGGASMHATLKNVISQILRIMAEDEKNSKDSPGLSKYTRMFLDFIEKDPSLEIRYLRTLRAKMASRRLLQCAQAALHKGMRELDPLVQSMADVAARRPSETNHRELTDLGEQIADRVAAITATLTDLNTLQQSVRRVSHEMLLPPEQRRLVVSVRKLKELRDTMSLHREADVAVDFFIEALESRLPHLIDHTAALFWAILNKRHPDAAETCSCILSGIVYPGSPTPPANPLATRV